MKVVSISPHPDDEAIGPPATLRALNKAGCSVENILLTLGSDKKLRARRLKEAKRAHQAAGISLVFREGASLLDLLPEADIYISPSLWDNHPRHEEAARILRDNLSEGSYWWQWNLWGELPRPSLLYSFENMREIQGALTLYKSQLARHDFLGLVKNRARLSSIRGAELIDGFGSISKGELYGEIFLEGVKRNGIWMRGKQRRLDPTEPLTEPSKDSLESLFSRSLL